MIPVKQLAASMRYSLKEMQGVQISDFELIEAINQAVWQLYSRIAERYVLAGVKKKTLIVDDSGEVALPSDFVKIHQVTMGDEGCANPATYSILGNGEYRILGDIFYAPEGVYGLEYYYIPMRVGKLSDYLDAPQAMAVYLVNIATAIHTNNIADAEQIIQVCVNSMAARELSHFQDTGPVQIFGGKL